MKYFRIVLLIVLFLVHTLISWMFFEMYLDAYLRGYRYPALITELIVLPLFYVISTGHVLYKVIKSGEVNKPVIILMLKYLGLLLLILILLFIAGMTFNDISDPGSNINF